MTVKQLKRLGFDSSFKERSSTYVYVRCSQCAVMVIQGIPTHELGCVNGLHRSQTKECKGCNNRVPAGVKYCSECQ